MRTPTLLAATGLAMLAPFAAAGADYTVARGIEVSAPPERIWHVVGDFCDIDDWHPAVSGCDLRVIDGALHRILTMADGGEFVEKRIAVEPGLSYTYQIVSGPMPIEGYTGTVALTGGEPSMITWSSRFSSDMPETEDMIAGFYEAGLAEIGALLAE